MMRSLVVHAASIVVCATATHAGSLTIDWYSVDGGGGQSASLHHDLQGAIGQADAGVSTSASFELTGGFWVVSITPSCPADLNLDGQVNGFDLAVLLGFWGVCPTPPIPCAPDLDENGVVNGFDLAILLGAWGPCPT